MQKNRIAALEATEKWPDRARHGVMFQQLLGDAYAASVKEQAPMAFVYIGQTEPAPTQGLLSSFALAHPTELLAAIENMVRTGHAAGQLSFDAILVLARELVRIAQPEETP